MKIYQHSDSVEATSVGDRTVLYHRTNNLALVLNPSASWLWSLLAHPRTCEELSLLLCENFSQISLSQAQADVEKHLSELQAREFILCDAPEIPH